MLNSKFAGYNANYLASMANCEEALWAMLSVSRFCFDGIREKN